MPSETPRHRRSKKRAREIVDKAAEIFQRKGYAGASVQDIADGVGILKGSLYYYIDSKEDLLYEVLAEVHSDAQTILEEVSRMDASPLERLHAYVVRQIAYNTRNLTKISVVYRDFDQLSETRRTQLIEQRRLYEEFVANLIKEAQERGEVHRSLDPKISAFFIFGALNWVYTWYRPGGALGAQELGELYAELSIRGLGSGKIG